MSDHVPDGWDFETDRLAVGAWHDVADRLGLDLARVVSELLTERTTVALPESWRSIEHAGDWIVDRDEDSSMKLVVESASQQPVGVVVLAEVPLPGSGLDLRIGYLLAETAWGRGLATELVAGLVDWSRSQPGIQSLTGGVDPANQASVRVLEKCGFEPIGDADPGVAEYRFDLSVIDTWDSHANGWDADPAVRAYAAAAFASLRRLLDGADVDLAGARVIDFGCGTGLLTERLVAHGATVEAVDTSTAMLDVVDTKTTEHGWTGVRTSTSLPLERSAFDLVVCSSVCSFLDDYPAMVDALVERLRSGGRFVQWDWERTGESSHGLTRTEVRDALVGAGLIDVDVSGAFDVSVDDMTMSPIMGHGRRPFSGPSGTRSALRASNDA